MQSTQHKKDPKYAADAIPLCVDLDHSLIRTDTLVEAVSLLLKTKPWMCFMLPFWLARGRLYLKIKLASLVRINPVHLPYNREVFFYLKRMARRGRKLILVTGAHESIAQDVCNYLGVFDSYIASGEHGNNVGVQKAENLRSRFGEKGYDYLGDSKIDLHVWRYANSATIVSHNQNLAKRVGEVTRVEKVFRSRVHPLKALARAMRVHQWAKNFLIFVPMALSTSSNFAAHFYTCFWGFLAFSLLASSIYLINDIVDLESDRQHQDKRFRPFAAGDLSISIAAIAVPVLVCLAILASRQTGVESYGLILTLYLLVTNLYSFRLKKVPVLDILVLTSLYSLRLWAGSVLANAPLSEWLIAFSGFFFLSLAMIKRMSELLQLRGRGVSEAAGRGYDVRDIPLLLGLGSASGYGAIVVLSLYINSPQARSHYLNPDILWLICPILVYWFTRIWFLANRGRVSSDPVKFALTDPVSLGITLGLAVIWYGAKGFGWPM